jgi:glycosyltransferase involved in cell wall biosynthesis
MKLFSIIIPTYNRGSILSEALDSVKEQTYRPIEIILVDDGSTDNTKEVAEQWTIHNQENELLSLSYHYQTNAGPSAARNYGIKEIHGDYVQFLDSDDRLFPKRLEIIVNKFKTTGADFIQTGFEGVDPETGKVIQTLLGRPDQDQFELALKGCLWANTLRSAFKAQLVKKISPWNTEMTCFEDREYVERAVAYASKAVAIREVLASANRGGNDRISNKLKTYEGRGFRIYCEEKLAKNALKGANSSENAKEEFVSRLYGLALRSNASGWPEHGQKCTEIAKLFDVKLNRKGKIRRLFSKLGKIGGKSYLLAGDIKKIFN